MTFDSPSLPADAIENSGRSRRSMGCRLVERMMPAFEAGRLLLTLPSGETIERRGGMAGPEASMVVHRWRGLRRMASGGEKGFTDGYLAGDWSTPDLGQLLEFCTRNEAALSDRAEVSWLGLFRDRVLHRRRINSKRGSRRNIAAHYDLGNAFYREWLDGGMNYSSAIYTDGATLETAQETKLERIARLLDLKGGERVLEIGCGWGALAERILRRGCTIVGLTLSSEQLAYAKERLAPEVESGHADLRLQDYRDVDGPFDRVASVEMIEAVGERYWPAYFGKIRECLTDGGIAVLQAITIAEDRYTSYRARPDFIQRHIFPGGMLPTAAIIASEAMRAGLKLVHQDSFGQSYAKTLAEWRERFLRAWPKIEPLGFDDRFRRMWEYYLAYCEVGFRNGLIDVGMFKLVRQPSPSSH